MNSEITVKREETQSYTEKDNFLMHISNTLSLFVNTDNPNKKFMIACKKDDSVRKVCKIVANAYFSAFLANNSSDDEEDPYYEKASNDIIKVESLSSQGYILPRLHKIGDLLKDKSQVTARVIYLKPIYIGALNTNYQPSPISATFGKRIEKPDLEILDLNTKADEILNSTKRPKKQQLIDKIKTEEQSNDPNKETVFVAADTSHNVKEVKEQPNSNQKNVQKEEDLFKQPKKKEKNNSKTNSQSETKRSDSNEPPKPQKLENASKSDEKSKDKQNQNSKKKKSKDKEEKSKNQNSTSMIIEEKNDKSKSPNKDKKEKKKKNKKDKSKDKTDQKHGKNDQNGKENGQENKDKNAEKKEENKIQTEKHDKNEKDIKFGKEKKQDKQKQDEIENDRGRDKPEKIEKTEKQAKQEKHDKTEKKEKKEKQENQENHEKQEKQVKQEKQSKQENQAKSEKSEKNEKSEKEFKIEKHEKTESKELQEKKEKFDMIIENDKHEKLEKKEKLPKIESEKNEKIEKSEVLSKSEKLSKNESYDKQEKIDKPEKNEKPEKIDKVENKPIVNQSKSNSKPVSRRASMHENDPDTKKFLPPIIQIKSKFRTVESDSDEEVLNNKKTKYPEFNMTQYSQPQPVVESKNEHGNRKKSLEFADSIKETPKEKKELPGSNEDSRRNSFKKETEKKVEQPAPKSSKLEADLLNKLKKIGRNNSSESSSSESPLIKPSKPAQNKIVKNPTVKPIKKPASSSDSSDSEPEKLQAQPQPQAKKRKEENLFK